MPQPPTGSTDDHGVFERLYRATPESNSAQQMANELGISPLYASALACWLWLFNRDIGNNARRLTITPGRRRLLDTHFAYVTAGEFADSAAILDAMHAAGWVEIEFGPKNITVDLLTWDAINGSRDTAPGSVGRLKAAR